MNAIVALRVSFAILTLLIIGFGCSPSVSTTPTVPPPKSIQTPTPSPTSSSEQAYITKVNSFIDKFYNHRKEFNTGLQSKGEKFRSATTESKQRQALQEVITHLENCHGLFLQDMEDFAAIIPPNKYQDFYVLMNSVLRDYEGALAGFTTYYSRNLNMGEQDSMLLTHSSDLLRTANENLQRAALMYKNLIGQ